MSHHGIEEYCMHGENTNHTCMKCEKQKRREELINNEALTPNQYQELAWSTASHKISHRDAISNWAMGLCGESGELADVIKKFLYHDHSLEMAKVKSELGDVLWYCAVLAKQLNLSLEEVMKANVIKLSRRYPDGFDTSKSINREEYKK